jgi:hypothetical protein
VPCPVCARPVFILPDFPFSPAAIRSEAGAHSARGRFPGRAWRIPLFAAALTAAFVVAVYLVLFPRLQRGGPAAAPVLEPERPQQQIEAGRQKLAEGRFRTALDDFNAAIRQRDQRPELLSPVESRQLDHWHRQCDLLARLLSKSLQEILQEALDVRHEDEWQVRFHDDYRGKAVVFDDVVHRDEEGLPALRFYQVRAGEEGKEQARVALEDLTLLQQLPLDPPPRLLFGARLSGLSREKGGRWVFRFQPDSAVLLTDPGAAAACGPRPLTADTLEVLRRQEEWLRP